MTLKNAAFFAVVGMALLTVLLTFTLFRNFSGVLGGFIPAITLATSLIEWIASLSLLVFFAVFYRRQ
jgi:hypothetical protein